MKVVSITVKPLLSGPFPPELTINNQRLLCTLIKLHVVKEAIHSSGSLPFITNLNLFVNAKKNSRMQFNSSVSGAPQIAIKLKHTLQGESEIYLPSSTYTLKMISYMLHARYKLSTLYKWRNRLYHLFFFLGLLKLIKNTCTQMVFGILKNKDINWQYLLVYWCCSSLV